MISLRPVAGDDIERFYEYQNDPIARQMAVFGGGRDRETFMAHWQKILVDPDSIARTVVADAQVVGNVMSWSREGMRYVAYWIDREFWGRGIATLALQALCGEIAERPLYALVADSNIGSKRVLEKCGFTRTTEGPTDGPDGVPEWLVVLN